MRAFFFRLRLRHLVAVSGAIVLVSGCVSGSGHDSGTITNPRDAGVGPVPVTTVEGGSSDAGRTGDGGLDINSLCGTTDYCTGGIPDQRLACAAYDAGTDKSGFRPEAGVAAPDAARADGLDSGDGAVADGGLASRDGSSFGGSALDAGDGALPGLLELPIPPSDAGPSYACQVGRDNSDRPVHQCVPSGSSEVRFPCTKVSDCASGLGCVGSDLPEGTLPTTDEVGRCLPYCCGPSTMCDPGTYCAERRQLDGTTKKPLIVPVCTTGASCGLLEPYPCAGPGCSCPQEMSCTVVRGDGTMGCVKPGTGKVGDRCGTGPGPCAAGYYCSLATAVCVKICKTDGIDNRCTPGRCQAAAGFPAGFGLCVGYTPAVQ